MAKLFTTRNLFILIFILAVLLRLYRLPEYVQFLGDEGRDALAVKRMIVDHQWTLLGPTASVGGFYIGPIYYYFIMPFLWLFKLNPVGPAYFSVIVGLAMIVSTYYFCKKFFGEKEALVTTFLMSISPEMVYISRFSWNPNPMPFFALITILLVYFASVTKKRIFVFLAGLSVGIMQQLHYIDLIFMPILGLAILVTLPRKEFIKNIILGTAGFLLGDSLFLIFELRHNFPNIRSVLEFISRGGKTVSPRSLDLFWLLDDITRRCYEIVLGFHGTILNIYYYLSMFGLVVWLKEKIQIKEERVKIWLILIWLLIGALGVGSYQGTLSNHYFGYLFPLPFMFLGIFAARFLLNKKILIPFFLIWLVVLIYFEIKNLYLWYPPNNQVTQTSKVARMVANLALEKPYNFALITPGNSDHAYRYFLEVWQKAPTTIINPDLDLSRKTVTDQLIIVCEQAECKPLGNPLWEVAGFGRAEIAEKQIGPAGIVVYKLVHYRGK